MSPASVANVVVLFSWYRTRNSFALALAVWPDWTAARSHSQVRSNWVYRTRSTSTSVGQAGTVGDSTSQVPPTAATTCPRAGAADMASTTKAPKAKREHRVFIICCLLHSPSSRRWTLRVRNHGLRREPRRPHHASLPETRGAASPAATNDRVSVGGLYQVFSADATPAFSVLTRIFRNRRAHAGKDYHRRGWASTMTATGCTTSS